MGKTFKKQIKVKYSKQEIKDFINNTLLNNSILKTAIKQVEWEGDTLKFDSSIGDGYIAVGEQVVDVLINLNFMGSMMLPAIEQSFDEGFKKLEDSNE